MLVPILTDMSNHWFAQGAITRSVTKGVITLLKKGGRHILEELDHYKFITLLNTELKIWARVLANRLQLVISDLIWPEQNYAVKGKSTQDNLHMVCEVLEGLKDTKAALINLDQFKVSIGWTTGSWWQFWRPLDSNRSSANGWVCCTTTLKRWCRWTGSVRSGRVAPCRPFSMSLLWSPFSVGLGMRRQIWPYVESFLLAVSERRSLRTPMISLS